MLERLLAGEGVVLELVVVDELMVGEAATVLGISRVGARVRQRRARKVPAGAAGISG
ncbi:hypothetical protein [Streptomyces canus]|uniref:hypothetical protein n=1 Tax=Streptomyces canus TaxID=58343 RepID=UPI002E296119|nr:hypothetical protein [Streptomyces canus]